MSYLVVCPLSHLTHLVAKHEASHVLTVISADMPVETPPGIQKQNHLSLFFNDIARAQGDLTLAGEGDVRQMIAFARSWDRAHPMVIHCWAGVSRSTAAALTTMLAINEDLDDSELVALLRFEAPFASPNPHIVGLADRLLNRGGRLMSAVAQAGRGADCYEGTPFVLTP